MYKFKIYFSIPRENFIVNAKLLTKYYNWNDKRYSRFMIALLRALEPRKFKKDEIILRDQDEVEEIIFITKGEVSFLKIC